MIDNAANAGAWGAKVQTFFAEDLSDGWSDRFQHYKELELSWDDHAFFVERCTSLGLVPLTTIYSGKYLTKLKQCGFKNIKVGSAESTREHLLRQILMHKMNVFVSSGGREVDEIPNLPDVTCYFHCVSSYPGKLHESNLSRIFELRQRFQANAIGFSDHTDATIKDALLPAKAASALGAQYIEKHFTILPRNEVKDGPVSIDVAQLKELCSFDNLTSQEKLAELGPINLEMFFNPARVVADQAKQRQTINQYCTRWIS